MRRLILVPIVHTQADMGTLAKSIKMLGIRKLGRDKWQRTVAAIDELWECIRREIDKLRLPYARVRLYQDGLPVSGHETEIVRELARSRSCNHEFLLALMQQGATLMGTESPDLLLREYGMLQQVLALDDHAEVTRLMAEQKDLRQELLQQRDQFIAERINATLGDGEIGLLFLGMLHAPERWLASDIQVSHLVYMPATRGERDVA